MIVKVQLAQFPKIPGRALVYAKNNQHMNEQPIPKPVERAVESNGGKAYFDGEWIDGAWVIGRQASMQPW